MAQTSTDQQVNQQPNRHALRWEIGLLLAITFGASGLRAVLRLTEAVSRPEGLNEQQVTLNRQQSALWWLDPAFQLISTGVLFAWGGMAVFLLLRHVPPPNDWVTWRLQWQRQWRSPRQPQRQFQGQPQRQARCQVESQDRGENRNGGRSWRCWGWRCGPDWLHGAGLAAVIGLPGLAFYFAAVQLGLSKQVVPSGLEDNAWQLPLLVLNSWANGFAEEIIVVAWLAVRMRQLRISWVWVFVASAGLRASYHLYQGFSAGVGNAIMGVVYLWYFKKTGRIWPLVIAHGLIDTVAFVGYAVGLPHGF